ncbi:MAG: LysR family transcriptional regulator [Desulfobacterales bacterium]|nr:LysR family transcriptional regulator [Desulfobacterales bacterium]
MMLPDFNRLKIFYHIYQTGSVVLAAKELCLTQSGVSQHLQKLEDEIGVPLFTRLHKKLLPTNGAHKLFNIVSPFVDDLSIGVKYICDQHEKPMGHIKVGGPMEFSRNFLLPFLTEFQKMYPDVKVTLYSGNPAELLKQLHDGQIDVAFIDLFSSTEKGHIIGNLSAYTTKSMFEVELLMVCSKQYYDTQLNGDHSFENLINCSYGTYEENGLELKSWFKHHFEIIPSKLNIKFKAQNMPTVILWLKNHMGLGIVDGYWVADLIDKGEIVPITTDKPQIMNRISMMRLDGKSMSALETIFLDSFQEYMQTQKWTQRVKYLGL